MNIHAVRPLRLLLAGLVAVTLRVAPLHAASSELPPLVDPPSHEHHQGKVVWADLVTPDVEAAEAFYGGLFGWTFMDPPAGPTNYTLALLQGEPVAGLVRRSEAAGERHQPAWLTFLSVRDLDKATHVALTHGARQLSAPRTYPRRGRQVVLADPQGAVFAMMQSASGDPPDVLAEPGAWIWGALMTTDPNTDAAFYQALFDSEVFDSGGDPDSEHLVFSTDDYARASCNSFPREASRRDPHWLSYVRVTDVAGAAEMARRLGGRVLVEPRQEREGEMMAVVADPGGAPLGLLQWVDLETSDETAAGAAK
jgi:predicted enzyme related to lactoylglutathione lyase